MRFFRSKSISKKAMIKASQKRISELWNKSLPLPDTNVEAYFAEKAEGFVEVQIEEEMIEYLRSLIFLEDNDHLPVATPPKNDEDGYWVKGTYTGQWYLTDKGYEYLSEKHHYATQRNFEGWAKWLGLGATLLGALTGLGGVIIGVISILG